GGGSTAYGARRQRANGREFAKISTLGCPLCPPERSIATDGRRSLWHAAIFMRLPRREAASFLCDIHPLMSSWFRTAPPVSHPGVLIPTNLNSALVPPADVDTPPDRPHRLAPVGRSALNRPTIILVSPRPAVLIFFNF